MGRVRARAPALHNCYTYKPKAGQWSSPSLVSLPEAEHLKALPSKGSFLTILLLSPVLRNNQNSEGKAKNTPVFKLANLNLLTLKNF